MTSYNSLENLMQNLNLLCKCCESISSVSVTSEKLSLFRNIKGAVRELTILNFPMHKLKDEN